MNSKEYFKVIYITDVHEATKELRYIFKKIPADLYLVSGDLLYRSFFSYDTIDEFITLQESFYDLAYLRKKDIFPYDLARKIIKEEKNNLWLAKSHRYLELYNQAFKNMWDKYDILENIFKKYAQAPVYIIPGNYDLDPKKTSLEERSIHKKTVHFNGFKISGYGGADVRTPGIPEKLAVFYQGESIKSNVDGGAYKFFKREDPHIMIIHKPVYGHFDILPSYGNSGSISLANLVEEKNNIGLVLSGHVHENRGIHKSNGIVFCNPGNFGRTIQPVGFSKGGFFASIKLDPEGLANKDKNFVRYIKRFGIQKGQINLLEEKKFDATRKFFGKFSLFSEIQSYFLQFETSESKIKVRDLINIARRILKEGEKIAFDLLGSVSFGMSAEKSDVDLVLYHLCPENRLCDMNVCEKSKHFRSLLLKILLQKISKNIYNFEVIDCINIKIVLNALKENDSENDLLIRYIFYRKVGRAVNKRFLHSIDKKVNEYPELKKQIENKLEELIVFISETSSQKHSMHKYKDRLTEMGVRLPESIQEKIWIYLGFSQK